MSGAPDDYHRPVLADRTTAELLTRTDGNYLDGTVGGGGHLARLLGGLGAGARVLGLDRDPEAIEAAHRRIGEDRRVTIRHAPFSELAEVAHREQMVPLDGVLLDLGVSSHQLDESQRGFTYRVDAPLDMRMDPDLPLTAADLLATLAESDLADLFRRYGEVRSARRLAASLTRARASARVEEEGTFTSGQLRAMVAATVAPAEVNAESSRVFQALRIAVNDEMGQLEAALEGAVGVLAAGGRLAVIAYHSLEDRMVKHFFRERSTTPVGPRGLPAPTDARAPELRVVTPRPIRPDAAEVAANPRARSARLRVAERLAEGATR